jgi:Predicted membrane protein
MLILKAVGGLTALFFFCKLLGKKQMAQLNVYDYIIGISIGNIVAEMSVNKAVPFAQGLIVLFVYTLVAMFSTYITTKSIVARRFMSGSPLVIIEDGKIIEKSLKKVKLDINDLLQEARIAGFFDLNEIEYALLEPNGVLSFLPKTKFKPLTPNDIKRKTNYKGLVANLIIDGNIMKNNLGYIKQDIKWLKTRLKNLGYDDIENILLATCDTNEAITVYEKNVVQKKDDCLE